MHKVKSGGLYYLLRLFVAVVIISFLGWIIETLYFYWAYHRFVDRGFLTLPLCGIYGAPLLILELTAGTPFCGRITRLLAKAGVPRSFRFIAEIAIYFLIGVALPTLFEIIIGPLFDKAFGVRLWDYTYFPNNYKGYVCLGFSLVWGVLLTVSMATLWRGLLALTAKFGERSLIVISAVILSLLLIDFSFNIIYLLCTGKHFTICYGYF